RQAVEGGEVEVIASFRNVDGELCREFEHDGPDRVTVVSVACRAVDRWQPRFAVIAGAADSDYAPASSLATLDAYLAAIGAGAPMAADEEKKALEDIAR
ncbi:MAG: anti-sigma factor family protein, partial [Rhodovulum sp.]